MADVRLMKPTEQETDLTEAQIAVHWREEQYYYPSAKFIRQATLSDPAVNERFAEKNFPECFREYADLLSWDQYWHTTLDTSDAPFWKWFVGGKLNLAYNCIDRHLEKYRNKAAFIFVGEPEQDPPLAITYQDLYYRVNEVAAMLRDFCGLKTGDRVTIHMPVVPELPVTMLACARLGLIHSVVFGGFSGEACGMRAADSGSRVLVTIDGYYRSGHMTDHKEKADLAVDVSQKEGQKIEKVLVWRREAGKYHSAKPMVQNRDFFVDELLRKYHGQIVEPVSMPSEVRCSSCTPAALRDVQRDASMARAAIFLTWPGLPGSSRMSILKMFTGVWPISVGLPAIPISSMVRWLWRPPAFFLKAFRITLMRGDRGALRTG